MSALIFVQHPNQLAGLIGRDVTVAILEVQNHRLSRSCVNGTADEPQQFLDLFKHYTRRFAKSYLLVGMDSRQ